MKIRDYYRQLSAENRAHFWNIATSCIVAIVTFWVGLSIQYIVYNKGAEESKKFAHYQIVDKFYPMYLDLYDSNKEIMSKLLSAYYSDNQNEKFLNIIRTEVGLIQKTARESVDATRKIMPYLDNEACQVTKNNNAVILVGLKLFELAGLKDMAHIRDSLISYMTSGEYRLLAGDNEKIKDIVSKTEEFISLFKNVLISDSKNSFALWEVQDSFYINFLLKPIINNYILIHKELYVNGTSFWNIITYCVSCLIICLIIGYLIFVFLVKKAFAPKDLRNQLSPDEVRKQTNKLRAKEEECSLLKASLFAKDQQIEKQEKDLKNKAWYILSLERKLKDFEEK